MPEIQGITFPLELVDLVIDHSFDDHEILKICSLVSLECVRRSRLHLFHTVALRNTRSIQTLVELLESPLSTIACAIRCLSVDVGPHFDFVRGQAETYTPYLTRLNNTCTIESLQFVSDRSDFRNLEFEIFLSPWACFKSVQFLTFGPVRTSPAMRGFIASFPILRELEMDNTFWRPTAAGKLAGWKQSPPSAHLQAVRLSRCASQAVLKWLLPESPQAATCSLLELCGIHDHTVLSIAKFLDACGPVLQHLSLSRIIRLSTQAIPLDFSCNTNLRYLRIEPQDFLEALPQLLCSLTSASLEQIELVKPVRRTLQHLDPHNAERWANVDHHFLQPQFSRLLITVHLHQAFEEEIIRGYLPLCAARRIMSCVLG
ncbi:hypothetical protein MVEN_01941800 [Mycena venus]|uniref:F-box domain-containing protein n=1 Tax=Mycena venus TaxID=2733690 RepID=A0A8H6XGV0_9AGAR|nr:hypothetical protein MVEN_01941800 [Mycena venus]